MRKRILWLVVSTLMALSLVMAACAPAATPPTTTPPTTTPPVTTPPTTTPPTTPPPVVEPPQTKPVPPSTDVPKYGGTLTIAVTTAINTKGFWTSPSAQVYEQFMGLDWTRGSAGSGVTDFNAGMTALEDNMGPILAESWKMPQPGIWILNIRRGVHWQKTGTPAGNLMNGREMTADDVVNSFNWQIKEGNRSWIHVGQKPVADASTIEKTGPWEVTIKTPVDYLTSWTWIIQGAGYHVVYPAEVEKKYAHQLVYQGEGWPYAEAVGTGPYMVSEAVAGTLIKYVKNPDYWAKDILGAGKGNQLPYIDTVVELSLPDKSTQLAAMRTGKIAYITGLTRDEQKTEMGFSPKLQSAKYLQTTTLTRFIAMRTDKKDKPFSDVRVRQALMMATDFNAIKNGYYGGEAEIDVWPLNKNFKASGYVPLNEMPKTVQDLYVYNPDKAKQLLKEAGYPNGFKTSVVVTAQGSDVDELSIFKDMWAKVGVDLVLDVKDATVFLSIQTRRAHEEMLYRMMWTTWPMMYYFSSDRGPSTNNLSYINDPIGSDKVVEDSFQAINSAMMADMPKVYQLMRELRVYLMEQAHVIPRPTPYYYNVWQPWFKNYYGFLVTKYHWIDQDLKKSMGQ